MEGIPYIALHTNPVYNILCGIYLFVVMVWWLSSFSKVCDTVQSKT